MDARVLVLHDASTYVLCTLLRSGVMGGTVAWWNCFYEGELITDKNSVAPRAREF